jgi:hypothetical protein
MSNINKIKDVKSFMKIILNIDIDNWNHNWDEHDYDWIDWAARQEVLNISGPERPYHLLISHLYKKFLNDSKCGQKWAIIDKENIIHIFQPIDKEATYGV